MRIRPWMRCLISKATDVVPSPSFEATAPIEPFADDPGAVAPVSWLVAVWLSQNFHSGDDDEPSPFPACGCFAEPIMRMSPSG